MKKKIVLIIFCFFIVIGISHAEPTGSGTVDEGSGNANLGEGKWNDCEDYNYRITVYDSNNNNIATIQRNEYIPGWVTTSGGKCDNQSWDQKKLYEHLNIPYEGYAGDYANLISILNEKGVSSWSYLFVEPTTSIDHNQRTFREIKNEDNLATPIVRLANIALNGTTTTVGGNKYRRETAGCDKLSECRQATRTGLGIIVIKYSYVYKKGKVKIEKYKSDGETLITSSPAYFKICSSAAFTDGRCTADSMEVDTTGGSTDWIELDAGTYYYCETKAPIGYYGDEDGENIPCRSFQITSNAETSLKVINKTDCEQNFINNIPDRIELYKTLKGKGQDLRNLLNFNINNASQACTTGSTITHQYECLSASPQNNIPLIQLFPRMNWSGYNQIVESNGVSWFCLNTINLKNEIGKTSFHSIRAGSLFDEFKGLTKNNRYAVRGFLNRLCYAYDKDAKINGNSFTNKLTNYVEEIKFNNKSLELFEESEMRSIYTGCVDSSCKIKSMTQGYKIDFAYLPFYVNNIDGKISNISNNRNRLLGYGEVSKLNDKKGEKYNLPFTITFKEGYNAITSLSGNSITKYCNYTVGDGIVDPPESGNPETLKLEFRVIDTKNPFPGKLGNGRRAGRNWCVASIEDNKIYRICAKRTLQSIASSGINNIENLSNKINLGGLLNVGGLFGSLSNELEKLQQEIKNSIMVDLSEEERTLLDIDSDSEITIEDSMLFLKYFINWKTPQGEALNKVNQLRTYYSNNPSLLDHTELDCASNNSLITENIINSTDSYGYNKSTNTYNNTPMYHIELDSRTINRIRDYNKQNQYDNYDMTCDEDGKNCTSNFLDNLRIWNSENIIPR